MKKNAGFQTVGRRKSAVARVFLRPGAGNITVNDLPADEYFGRATSRMIIRQPLVVTNQLEKFDIVIVVNGGGKDSQAGAVRLGISRALIQVDPAQRKALKVEGYLTRDSREVERKKYGRHGARRRPQFSKR